MSLLLKTIDKNLKEVSDGVNYIKLHYNSDRADDQTYFRYSKLTNAFSFLLI